MTTTRHERIQSACKELEKAIEYFEDDSELSLKAKKDAEKIKELKSTLNRIKEQLEELSS